MAIRLITGKPGSGKTYYAVKHIRDNYFRLNKKSTLYEAKEKITIITNIRNLNLDHLNIDDILNENNL